MKKILAISLILISFVCSSIQAQQPVTTDIVSVGDSTFKKLVNYIQQEGDNTLTKSKDFYTLSYDYEDELSPRKCTFVCFNSLEEGTINVYVSSKKSKKVVSSFTITKKQLVFGNDDPWTLQLNQKFYKKLLAEAAK